MSAHVVTRTHKRPCVYPHISDVVWLLYLIPCLIDLGTACFLSYHTWPRAKRLFSSANHPSFGGQVKDNQ